MMVQNVGVDVFGDDVNNFSALFLGACGRKPPEEFKILGSEELVLAGDDENTAKGAQCVVGHEQRAS